MSVKISELPSASSVTSSDVVPIVQGGTTKQANLGIVASAGGVPTNSILQYDGDTIPAGYEEVNGFDNYSTTEQRIGTWIDGKPLYEQTYIKTAPSSSGTFVGNDTWLGTGYDLIFVRTAIVIDSASQALTMPFITNGGNLIKCYAIAGNQDHHTGEKGFTISSNYSGVNGSTCYITIRYTKTTDSAS